MKSTREKFNEIENIISHSTCKEGHEMWCKTMSTLWSAFEKDYSIIEKLHPIVTSRDGCTGEYFINTINDIASRQVRVTIDAAKVVSKIQSKIDSLYPIGKISDKKHIIAFNDLDDVPIVLVDGTEVSKMTSVSVNWTTSCSTHEGNRHFNINWFDEGLIKKGVGRY